MKVFEVYPGLPGEDRYRRLIEENGRPVPADKLASEDRPGKKRPSRMPEPCRAPRAADQETRKQDKDRRELQAVIDDLFRVYDVRLVGRESIDGRDAIVATATPRAGVKPTTDDGKIMQHFRARAWINEAIRRSPASRSRPSTICHSAGACSRVCARGPARCTSAVRSMMRPWLPARVTWTGSARLFLVKQERVSGVSEFSNYRKFTVGTSTTYGTPPR